MTSESSFIKGFKGGIGAIAAIFFIFIILPCGVCGGIAMCGASTDSFERYQERANEAREEQGTSASREEVQEETKPISKWRVQEDISEMDDSRSVHLILESENEVEDWLSRRHRAKLIVRCVENKTRVLINTGVQANPELGNYNKAHARIRLDDQSAQTVNLSESTTGEALFFPGSTKYARSFQGHERLRFEFTPFQTNSQLLEFDLRGYDEVLPRVQEACGWE